MLLTACETNCMYLEHVCVFAWVETECLPCESFDNLSYLL